MERMGDTLDNLVENLETLDIAGDKEEITIRIENKVLTCGLETLRTKSKYFQGFLNFDSGSREVEIRGGIDKERDISYEHSSSDLRVIWSIYHGLISIFSTLPIYHAYLT